MKCIRHDSLKTNTHAILYTVLLSAWPPPQVKDMEMKIDRIAGYELFSVAAMLASKSNPPVVVAK